MIKNIILPFSKQTIESLLVKADLPPSAFEKMKKEILEGDYQKLYENKDKIKKLFDDGELPCYLIEKFIILPDLVAINKVDLDKVILDGPGMVGLWKHVSTNNEKDTLAWIGKKGSLYKRSDGSPVIITEENVKIYQSKNDEKFYKADFGEDGFVLFIDEERSIVSHKPILHNPTGSFCIKTPKLKIWMSIGRIHSNKDGVAIEASNGAKFFEKKSLPIMYDTITPDLPPSAILSTGEKVWYDKNHKVHRESDITGKKSAPQSVTPQVSTTSHGTKLTNEKSGDVSFEINCGDVKRQRLVKLNVAVEKNGTAYNIHFTPSFRYTNKAGKTLDYMAPMAFMGISASEVSKFLTMDNFNIMKGITTKGQKVKETSDAHFGGLQRILKPQYETWYRVTFNDILEIRKKEIMNGIEDAIGALEKKAVYKLRILTAKRGT